MIFDSTCLRARLEAQCGSARELDSVRYSGLGSAWLLGSALLCLRPDRHLGLGIGSVFDSELASASSKALFEALELGSARSSTLGSGHQAGSASGSARPGTRLVLALGLTPAGVSTQVCSRAALLEARLSSVVESA